MSPGREPVTIDAASAMKILQRYVVDGRISVLPAKRTNRLVVFEWLACRFDVDRRYAEREVNEIIQRVHADYATLRRGLYDEYFFDREESTYWRTPARQMLSLIAVDGG